MTILLTKRSDIANQILDFNLGINDDRYKQSNFMHNRQYLQDLLFKEYGQLAKPNWLLQTHGNRILKLEACNTNYLDQFLYYKQLYHDNCYNYDASYTFEDNIICGILTADCLPILITNKTGDFVASVHAGWRGILNGIIFDLIDTILCKQYKIIASEIMCYIGPSICMQDFIIGQDVYQLFIKKYPDLKNNHNNYFLDSPTPYKYHCNLNAILFAQLLNCGILNYNIFNSNICTYCSNDIFYSYRKEQITGRFASLIFKI